MKKLFFLTMLAVMFSFYACGPSAEEKENVVKEKATKEKITKDSTASELAGKERIEAWEKAMRDSLAKVAKWETEQHEPLIIGTQGWSRENLDVTTFRNGDVIREAKTYEEFVVNEPVWAYNLCIEISGPPNVKLYNWYAVKDPRGLAPKGWHIPSHDEWKTLMTFVNGLDEFGVKSFKNYDDMMRLGFPKGCPWWSSTFSRYVNDYGRSWICTWICENSLEGEGGVSPFTRYWNNGLPVLCIKD